MVLSIQILLVEDHPVVRRGIVQLLNEEPDMEVCGEVATVEDACAALKELTPHVAVVDISLRDSNGIDLLKIMRTQFPQVKAMILSMHAEVGYVERALRAGAKGYVTKDQADATIIEAVRKVHGGGLYIQENLNEEVLERLVAGPEKTFEDRIEELSSRERAVFELMGKGKDTKEIAYTLQLNLKTVETYRRRIKAKLDIDSMSKLAYTAFEYFSARDAT